MKLKLEVEPGETIQDACREAQEIADKTSWNVEFKFNSVDCVAVPGGDENTLHSTWFDVKDRRPRVTSMGEVQ
jgi:hypothetical protein